MAVVRMYPYSIARIVSRVYEVAARAPFKTVYPCAITVGQVRYYRSQSARVVHHYGLHRIASAVGDTENGVRRA